MVFSTATQPDFSAIPDAEWKPIELIPENSALYDKLLRRVSVAWQSSEKTELEQIACEMADEASIIFKYRSTFIFGFYASGDVKVGFVICDRGNLLSLSFNMLNALKSELDQKVLNSI